MKKRIIIWRVFKKKLKKEIDKIEPRKKKLFLDVLNTIITMLVGIALLGVWGIVIAFIPDIMLIFIISDLWQKDPKDKLIGIKLNIHLMLHSISFIIILFLIVIFTIFISTNVFWIALKISVILVVHVIIDQIIRSKKYGVHFGGYSRSDYGKEEEKLRKQMLEQIDKLDSTQLSELYLNVLKETIGGHIEKSNKEYLVDLMIKHKINLFKENIKK